MKSNMTAASYITLSALSFSMFPVVAILFEIAPSSVSFAMFLSVIMSTLFFYALNKRNNFSVKSSLQLCLSKKTRKIFAIRAFAGLNIFFLAVAFFNTEQYYVATLIAESYPIFSALLATFLFSSLTLRKRIMTSIYVVLCVLVLICVAYFFEMSLLSTFCITIAALLSSLSSITEPKLTAILVQETANDNFVISIMNKFATCLFTLLLSAMYMFFFVDFSEIYFSSTLLLASFLFAMIDVAAGITSRLSGVYVDDTRVFLLYYLTPIFSFIFIFLVS